MFALLLIFAQLASGESDGLRVEVNLALDGHLVDRAASAARFTVQAEGRRRMEFRTVVVTSGDDVEQELALDYVVSREPIDAVIGTGLADMLVPISEGVNLSPSALPRYAPAYAQVASLAIDNIALKTLDDEQLGALLDFVSGCGRVLLVGASPAVRRIFASQAACMPSQLHMPDPGASPDLAYRQLLARDRPSGVSARQLQNLAAPDNSSPLPVGRIAGFQVAFAATFLLLISRPSRRWSAVGLAIGATLLAPVLWPGGTQRSLTAWAEATAEDRIAHFASLERIAALRPGKYDLPVASVGTMQNAAGSRHDELLWSPRVEDRRRTWDATTLNSLELFSRGSFATSTTLRAGAHETGVVVCNVGSGSTRPAHVQRAGTLHEIPPLEPGERWLSGEVDPLDADRPELRLFLQRSDSHEISILQDLPLPAQDERGWIVRFESVGLQESPC